LHYNEQHFITPLYIKFYHISEMRTSLLIDIKKWHCFWHYQNRSKTEVSSAQNNKTEKQVNP